MKTYKDRSAERLAQVGRQLGSDVAAALALVHEKIQSLELDASAARFRGLVVGLADELDQIERRQ